MEDYKEAIRDWVKDFVKALLFFVILQTYFIQGFVIEGACMEPQLKSSEKILVNKLLYRWRTPKLGEVVVFTFPLDRNKDFIKRVVGCPGDLLEIRDGYLYRNGLRMSEPFVKEYVFGAYGPLRVPRDKICVMGDNRNNSHDSRSWGFLDLDQVKGRAEMKFWPPWSIGLIPSHPQ
jgi:signal peptidase I